MFVVATMLLVLLSSCAVKTSIKTLIGASPSTEQNLPKGNQNISSAMLEKCAQVDVWETQTTQKFSFHASDLLPAVLFTAAFLFLFSFRPVSNQRKHPRYSGSGKIRSAVPIFLEYRKLIIHYSH